MIEVIYNGFFFPSFLFVLPVWSCIGGKKSEYRFFYLCTEEKNQNLLNILYGRKKDGAMKQMRIEESIMRSGMQECGSKAGSEHARTRTRSSAVGRLLAKVRQTRTGW